MTKKIEKKEATELLFYKLAYEIPPLLHATDLSGVEFSDNVYKTKISRVSG